jgi:hypothetical protein
MALTLSMSAMRIAPAQVRATSEAGGLVEILAEGFQGCASWVSGGSMA